MNRRPLIALVLVAVALAALGLFFAKRETASFRSGSARMGERLLPGFAVNDVAEIRIKQSTGEVNLVQKNDAWVVRERGDYPASFGEISDLLRKFWDLKVAQPIRVGDPSSLPRLELGDQGTNSGTLVEFKDKNGKVIRNMLLGKKHLRESASASPYGGGAFPDGRFVMVGKDLKTVSLVSEPLSNAEPKPEAWLDKEFFKIEKVRAISLVATNATNSWKISRESETAEWKLADPKPGEQIDPNKVSGVANSLSNPGFVDVVPGAKAEETGLDKPAIATFETFDDLTYQVRIGRKVGEENYYLSVAVSGKPAKERTPAREEKAEDKAKLDKEFAEHSKKMEEKIKLEQKLQDRAYIVAKWTIDPLLRDRAQLLAEKKDDKSTNAAPANITFPPPAAPPSPKAEPPNPTAPPKADGKKE